ncbi:hypothetical protein RQP46_005319 [Phenoliferia psychrophenolica]
MENQDNPTVDAKPEATTEGIGADLDASMILTGKKLAVVFASMLLAILLVSLDQTILATALPRIASDFNAFSLQGWVSSSFILTSTAFLLVCGQILRIYPAKLVLLASVSLFEVGSVVCGSSHSIRVLIFGRALMSMLQILAQVTLLEDRPKLFGPLIGGAFTDNVSWRWCFYINLPVGAVTLASVSFLLKSSPPLGADPEKQNVRGWLEQTRRMDWIGGMLVLSAVTMLDLALNWGGVTKPWDDAAVITTFVLCGVCTVALVLWQRYLREEALVPYAIFKSVSVYAIIIFCFCTRFSLLFFTYCVPIYYQAGRNHSAEKSGIDLLPLMMGVVITVIIAGQTTSRLGHYWPWLVTGPNFLAVGAGLMYTVNEHTSSSRVIGYQILTGVGIGSTMQNCLLAMQAEFRDDPKHLAQATGMASFGQFLGGTIGLAVAESVFSSQLTKNLSKYAPGADAKVIKESPVSIYTSISKDLVPSVVKAYVKSIDTVFIIGVPLGVISLVLAFLIKDIDVRARKPEAATEGKPEESDSFKVEGSPEASEQV